MDYGYLIKPLLGQVYLARNLPAADTDGQIDPYFTVNFIPTDNGRITVVKSLQRGLYAH
jgi:hypothetical protein